jgi:uncharacterized protein YjdB
MSSVLLPFTPEVKQSAEVAGLQTFMRNDTTLDVYSCDTQCLSSWMTSNNITANTVCHQLTPRMTNLTSVTLPSITPQSTNVHYFHMGQVRSIYNFPTPSASGYVVGVVSFGGGLYGSVDSQGVLTNGDVQGYWTAIGIASQNQPKVIIVPINGATNSPNINDGGSTMENTLDVETIGGACPSANLTIIMYIAPNTLDQFPVLLNYMYSTNVTVNGVNYRPNLISCSWGAPEIYYTNSALSSINSILSTLTAAGINMCVATGDNGSNDGVGGSSNYVDFPSSNPYSTAVGGTNMVCPNNIYDGSTVETAWSSGGGGVSSIYTKPSYQSALSGTYRSIPDLASLADPNTGVIFMINGSYYVVGGTSVAAPIIAGFLACIRCSTFINPLLYQIATSSSASSCFHDMTSGSNGSYSAHTGYDDCTGWGSINGVNLANAISALLNTVSVSGITFNSTSISLTISQTFQITTTVAPSNATNKTLSWVSSNTGVATVSNTGLVTAVAAGTTTITATSADGSNISATASVTITASNVSVSGITVNPTTLLLSPTQTSQITAAVTPSNATNKTVSWVSSNTGVATVSATGLVTAVAVGTSTITATSIDGSNKTATTSVTVSLSPISVSGVSLNQSTATMYVSNTLTLTPTISPSNANNKAVTWSSNSSNATVNSSGVVSAVSSGTATIRVTTADGGYSATCVVTILVHVSSISISPSTFTMNTGTTKALTSVLTTTILPSNASNKSVTWSSANSSVVSISSGNIIAGSSPGTTTITVRTADMGYTATATVNTVVAVQSITLNTSSITLAKNATFQAIANVMPTNAANKTVSWVSALPSVATVTSNGLITGVAAGLGVVSAITQDGNKTASMSVRVIVPVSAISLNQTSISIARNTTYSLVATISPNNASIMTVTWYLSNASVATVSSTGVVRGVSIGTTTVSVQTTDGNFISSCTVIVH